jgi:regulator of protease activity HflC (stomatin/prohibitin superfamily)
MDKTQIICFVIIFVISGLYIAWRIYKNGLRKVAIELIVKAEATLHDNQEKFEAVCAGIIVKLPFPFSFIITTAIVEEFVQKVFDEVKIALDYRESEVK